MEILELTWRILERQQEIDRDRDELKQLLRLLTKSPEEHKGQT